MPPEVRMVNKSSMAGCQLQHTTTGGEEVSEAKKGSANVDQMIFFLSATVTAQK